MNSKQHASQNDHYMTTIIMPAQVDTDDQLEGLQTDEEMPAHASK